MAKNKVEEKKSGEIPDSAQESLEKIKWLFVINGYNVEDLIPKRREHNRESFWKPDVYKTPIEYSVNDVNVALYGNVLVINDVVTGRVPNNLKETYRFILSFVRDKSETKKVKKKEVEKVYTSSNTLARYLKACLV